MVYPKRGTEAMQAMGVLGSFAGVAVHDAWAPYDTYTGPEHQLCCAHALREFQRYHVANITPAKSADTRQRRIDKAIALFRAGKQR